MTEAFPLKWPIGRERHSQYSRKNASFKVTPGRARDELLHELKLLGARDVVISSNVATYRRGGQDIMYADQTASKEDPGVAVYYTWKGEQYALACDRYTTVTDNLQALNKTVNAAFAGFKELPQSVQPPYKRPWWEVLGISENATQEEIKNAYRYMANKVHPDKGGTAEAFLQVREAFEIASNGT